MNGDTLLYELNQRLLPKPRRMTLTEGELDWSGRGFAVQLQGAWTPQAQVTLEDLVHRFDRSHEADPPRPVSLRVYCGAIHNDESALFGDPGCAANERYELEIAPTGIHLSAPNAVGVLRGSQTLAQLLTLPLERLPCLRIEDEPEIAWRGLLIDVARHFIELPALFRTLEGMAHHKLNVLHLHLTDDQAFRFPSSAFPRLNTFGATYTRAELEALVAHAHSLGIRVVPELDMPGHTTCWLAAYPEWSLYPVTATDRFGVHKGCLNPADEATYEVIGTLLDEFAEVFPDRCVHVGGDEVHPEWWSTHPALQSFMAAPPEGVVMETPGDVQAYFNTRVAQLLADRGKRMLLWDEAVHDSLPQESVIQAWRGMTARDAATRAGHACIVSAPYYLDLFYPADLHTRFSPLIALGDAIAAEDEMLNDERLAHVAGGLEWTKQWRDRPLAEAADPEQNSSESARGDYARVFGAEACLWSELVDGDVLDVRLWSRLPLLAELFWRGSVGEAESAYTRLIYSLRSWEALGGPVLTDALGGSISKDQFDVLAVSGVTPEVSALLAVLEPSKWYSRLLGADALAARLQGQEMPKARPYGTTTPLRGIADVISPQSYRAAEFAELLQRWCAAPLSEDDRADLQRWLNEWRRQPAAVAELALAAPLAQQLSTLAQALATFAEHVAAVLHACPDRPLDAEDMASVSVDELRALLAPVGELMLALPAAWLAVAQAAATASQPHTG